MPGRDNTGPTGMGPMTGRGLGNCGGNRAVGGQGPGLGRGLGFGRGRGQGGRRGRRNRFLATGSTGGQRVETGMAENGEASKEPMVDESQELDVLKQQAEQLAGTLEQINTRIAQLETAATKA